MDVVPLSYTPGVMTEAQQTWDEYNIKHVFASMPNELRMKLAIYLLL